MKTVAEVPGVSRSNLHDRLSGRTEPRRRCHKAQAAAVLPLITTLVAARPTYGCRRVTAILIPGLAALDSPLTAPHPHPTPSFSP